MERRRRITIRIVEAMASGESVWDADVRAFGVRRQIDKRVYFLKARIAGKQRWLTIGEHGAPWTPDSARKEAQRLWGMIRQGKDPALEHAMIDRTMIFDLCRRYMEEHAHQHKKATSAAMDQMNIDNHVVPLIGNKLVAEVNRADIDAFKRAVRDGKTASAGAGVKRGHRGGALVAGGPGVANRCLSLLSKMFNLAERWSLRADGSNPVRHVERYKEEKKERFLSSEELQRLGDALRNAEAAADNPFCVAAIRLLIFTGARRSEILNLRWENVDLANAVLDLPDSKTGRKRIYLNSPAQELLKSLPRIADNPFVVPGRRHGAGLINLQKPWHRVRARANLPDVRLHDLRHSFASVAVASGLTLPMIGKLLGHSKTATTERYAHLGDDPLRAANEKIGEELAKAVGRK